MNITNTYLKLFKATVNTYGIVDEYGVHIGRDRPKIPLPQLQFIEFLYVAATDIHQVSEYLKSERVYPSSIKEIDRLIHASVK